MDRPSGAIWGCHIIGAQSPLLSLGESRVIQMPLEIQENEYFRKQGSLNDMESTITCPVYRLQRHHYQDYPKEFDFDRLSGAYNVIARHAHAWDSLFKVQTFHGREDSSFPLMLILISSSENLATIASRTHSANERDGRACHLTSFN